MPIQLRLLILIIEPFLHLLYYIRKFYQNIIKKFRNERVHMKN